MPLTQIAPTQWRQIQRQNLRSLDALADLLSLTDKERSHLASVHSFPLNLPMRLAKKIEKNSLDDPIFRQFVPLKEHGLPTEGFVLDPVGDCAAQRTSNLLHKYSGRALLVTTGACAMHCRYCFRQHYDYVPAQESFAEELAILRDDSSISEVLLSGGDPLSLSDRVLGSLIQALDSISHIKRIRFHTRFPIGIPERLDQNFLQILAAVKKQIFFVIHCNHPSELDETVIERLKGVQKLGIPVLNQAVLLKGINDDAPTLTALCLKLADAGILPYYLHQLDRVQGAADFEVSVEDGLALIEAIRQLLPGYAVPQYVQEIAGELSKTPL